MFHKSDEIERITVSHALHEDALHHLRQVLIQFSREFDQEADIKKLISIADQENKRKIFDKDKSIESVLGYVKALLMAKSPPLRNHTERVAYNANIIAENLHLSSISTNRLYAASLLHDIGKLMIPTSLLTKKGDLSSGQLWLFRRHPEIGSRMMMGIQEMKHFSPFILFHHERWDGNGYPMRIAGEKIPYISRIISIADAFDAMTNDRPYRRAMTVDAAVCEISMNAGSQFDPHIANMFITAVTSSIKSGKLI